MVVEPVFEDTSSIGGYAPERGAGSLGTSPSSGAVRMGARVVGDVPLAGGLVFTAASPMMLPAPFFIQGAALQIAPTGYFQGTLAAWAQTPPMVAVDTDGDGILDQSETETIRLPVPAGATGDVFLQSFVLPQGLPLASSTVWRVRFP